MKLSLAITNLVENAIKYNKEHGWVKVLLDADHQFFTVEISIGSLKHSQPERSPIFPFRTLIWMKFFCTTMKTEVNRYDSNQA